MTRQTNFIRSETLEKRYPIELENEKKETISLLQKDKKDENEPKPMIQFSQLVSSTVLDLDSTLEPGSAFNPLWPSVSKFSDEFNY